MIFLLFLLDDRRIRIHISDYWIRTEAQKHMDPRIRIRNTDKKALKTTFKSG